MESTGVTNAPRQRHKTFKIMAFGTTAYVVRGLPFVAQAQISLIISTSSPTRGMLDVAVPFVQIVDWVVLVVHVLVTAWCVWDIVSMVLMSWWDLIG